MVLNQKSTYPEDLKNSLDNVLKSSRKIKVAVIDDHDFPYEDTLGNEVSVWLNVIRKSPETLCSLGRSSR